MSVYAFQERISTKDSECPNGWPLVNEFDSEDEMHSAMSDAIKEGTNVDMVFVSEQPTETVEDNE